MAYILHYIYPHLRQPKGLQSTLLLQSGRKPLAWEDEANIRKLNCRFTLYGGISPSVNWDLRFIRSSRDHDASSVIAALAFYPTDLCQGEKQIHFSFAFHLCVIFDTFLIYAYSTLFRCFQIICNDSLLLFSSKSNKPTHVQSGGYISLSLDWMVCQFVRFFKVIHDQY